MPTVRCTRNRIALIAAFPLLFAASPSGVSAQTPPQPPSPVSPLTKEQQAQTEALIKQASEAYARGDAKTAERLFLQVLATAEAGKDSYLMARMLNNLGIVTEAQGRYPQARDYFARSLALFENLGNVQDTVRPLGSLGNLHYTLGQFDQALECFTRVLAIREKLGDPKGIAGALSSLGNVALAQGRNSQALDYLKRALDIYARLGSPQQIADALHNLGGVYYRLGQLDKALDSFSRALAIREKGGDPQDVAQTLNNLGGIYYTLTQLDRAQEYYNRALAIREKGGAPEDLAGTLQNLGNISLSRDRNQQALAYYTRALDLFNKIGNPQDIAGVLNNLGEIYRRLNQPEKALDFLSRALALQEKIGNPQDIAETLNNLGYACNRLHQNEKALDFYQRALALREKTGNPVEAADTLHNLGDVYVDLGRLEEAERPFAEAKRLREDFALQVSDPAQIGALQVRYGHFYERYARLRLMRRRPEEALEMLEAGRGQGLTRQIALTERGDITRFFTAEEAAGFQEKIRSLRKAEVQLREVQQQAAGLPSDQEAEGAAQVGQAKAAAQKAEQAYTLLQDALFARHPQLRERAETRSAPFARLQELARRNPDTLYLEWGVVDEETTLLFALGSKDGLKALTLATGETALDTLAEKWRETLEISAGRGVKPANPTTRVQALGKEETLAKQAYQALLGEAQKAGLLAPGRYKRLVFVGSGPILEMPLAALCAADGKRLIERYPLDHAFSLSSFFYQVRNSPQTGGKTTAHTLLCIADPTGGRERPEPVSGKIPGAGAAPKASPAHFPPLPGARTEGKAIARLFPQSQLLIGPQAQEARVLSRMPGYGILHFATHGFVAPEALDSGLALAEEASGSSNNGLLTVRKILRLPLSAQLTVLSACETGRGKEAEGEGLMGLAWAFRAAGVPAVVASQWQVDDAATKQLMVTFYTELKAGKSKDDALRAAMLAVQKEHPSPYFWAAFELIGDASPLNLK